METNCELVGMGAADVAAGLSGELAVAGSLSETATADQAGNGSQITVLTAAALTVIVRAAAVSTSGGVAQALADLSELRGFELDDVAAEGVPRNRGRCRS